MDMAKVLALVLVGTGVANGCGSDDLPSGAAATDRSTSNDGSMGQGGTAGSIGSSGSAGAPVTAGGAGGASGGANAGGAPEGGGIPDSSASDARSADGPIVGANLTADSVVAAANLVAWYRFKSISDPGADSSKAGTNGAFFGDGVVETIDPQRGYVGIFNGSANEAFPPSVQADMTLALWLQTSMQGSGKEGGQWSDGSSLLDGESGGPVNDYGWTLLGSHVAFGVGNPDQTFDSKTSIVDGKWHHLAVTRDNTTGAVILYLDGANDGGGRGATGKRDHVNAHLLSGSGLVGKIADIRLYDRVLTPAEVAKITME